MKKALMYFFTFLFLTAITSLTTYSQWAQNKHAREDAVYARVMNGAEDIVIDGVEDDVWDRADSVIVGYGITRNLPSSGFSWKEGEHGTGDSANVVFKCLYKSPYVYLLFKSVDKNVGGIDWEQFDGLIISFKGYVGRAHDNNLNKDYTIYKTTHDLTGFFPWNYRLEHFPTFGWKWAGLTQQPAPGSQPILKGLDVIDGGGDTSLTEWTQFTSVIGGSSYDSLTDQGWISEHRMRVDSMGFNTNGDVIPFSFCLWDGDGFMDSTNTNNRFNKVWWGNEWNETWYYNALFIDPNVTTSSTGGLTPPVDYTIPRLREGDAVTVDGDISEWKADNTLHFKAKWGDEAAFDSVKGTGAWASGYQEVDWNNKPSVVDGPDVNYWVTYDDANLYVSAKVEDQIVTVPYDGRKDGITFFMVGRNYSIGSGIMGNVKELMVNVDSMGMAQAGSDLIALADTGGVEYSLMLGNGTNVNDISEVDSGYTVELKIPFASFNYPTSLGDSVLFIGALVNDVDVFEDANSNYNAKAWWFKWEKGQLSPAWVVLGPPNNLVGVNDKNKNIPTSIELYANYPNPFNPATTIKYSVTVNSDITLSVYNTLGQMVSQINKSNVKAGFDEIRFNAGSLSSGVYFYQLKVKNLANNSTIESKVNKMILLK